MTAPPNFLAARTSHRGFTAIEMLVTVSVLAILTAVASPSLAAFLNSQRVKTSSFDVYSSLMFARSEAIKRRSNISIVAGSTDWTSGWRIQDASSNVLRNQDGPKGVTITSSNSTLTYGIDGRLTTSGALLSIEALTNPDNAGRRCLDIDTTGVPRSRRLTGNASC